MIRLILASLRYHWRIHAAVALGVAAAVAVLTGALLVGDSMRGSLRDLALDRLGRIDEVLVADRFFREALADELTDTPSPDDHSDQAVPAILLRGSLTNPADTDRPTRANQINLIGCDERFWQLGMVKLMPCATAGSSSSASSNSPDNATANLPYGRRIVLNRPLAEQLQVNVGDTVIVRLAQPGTVPAESPLGRRQGTLESMRLVVGAIIEAKGLGAFGLNPSQQSPRNAYLALDTLQERLDQPDKVNAILVAGQSKQGELRPTLDDYGLGVMRSPRGYVTLSTDRMLFSRPIESALEQSIQKTSIEGATAGLSSSADQSPSTTIQPALTYLANTIALGNKKIPYSTVTAVDFARQPPLGPLLDQNGQPIAPLEKNEIVLNDWAANDLGAKIGDTITLTYFEPESLHGKLRESSARFRLAAIAPTSGAAADRDLLPQVPGVTDQTAMDDWDPPFPFDAKRIRPKDEDYWDEYRGTPKAWISLAAGRAIWAGRFGQTTTLRVATGDKSFENKLQENLPPRGMGFVFRPIRQESLAASAGATSFNLLFLGFSFFIIISAVLLVALLFRLGVELRAKQIGLLLAVGWTPRRVAQWLASEGAVVATLGGLLGVALGVGYAALMLLGLQTWWLDAIVTPFLRLHVTAASLAIGFAVGLGMSLAVIFLSLRRLGRLAPRRLMAGETTGPTPSVPLLGTSSVFHAQVPLAACQPVLPNQSTSTSTFGKRFVSGPRILVLFLLTTAAVLAVLFARIGDEFQAGAFFGVGALVLAGLITAAGWQLRLGNRREAIRAGRGNLLRLALLGAARHPTRSTLSIALVAAACFLIISVSAFRVDPSGRPPELHSGNGHFTLVGQSDLPIHDDLSTADGRRALGFSEQDNRRLDGCTIIPFRVRSGDDASCLNLYQPRRPRVLGVPEAMIERGGFAWAAAEEPENPWRALAVANEVSPGATGVPPVPMVLERDTAVYSLHLNGRLGATYNIENDSNQNILLKVVGQLKGSPFQGDLLISEEALLTQFPEVSGYRFFLIDCAMQKMADVQAAMERSLGDYGFTALPMDDYLAGFLAVPNTYLSTFQSLGGLGLLLGTFGLAVVQMRNVIERRRELALLRAVGLRRRQIAWLVAAENGLLLIAGLLCGSLAALVAVWPHLLSGDASIPLASLSGTLVLILLVGLAASLLAVRAAVTAPLLDALREE